MVERQQSTHRSEDTAVSRSNSTRDQRLMSELVSLISPQVDHTENQGNADSKLGFQEKGGRGSTLICGKSLLTLRGTLQMSIWRKEKSTWQESRLDKSMNNCNWVLTTFPHKPMASQ
ncbi:unnamed protein product [Caretta caretta]